MVRLLKSCLRRFRVYGGRRLRAAGLCGVTVLALAGCGGVASRSGGGTTPVRTVTTRVTETTHAGTTVTHTTTISLPGTGRPTVTIGDKNYDEQFILGQLYLRALQAQGFTVNITQNIGPPSVVRSALRKGSLAMYPEYLDTVDETYARIRHPFRTAAEAYEAAERWADRNNLVLLTPTPFSDTDAVAVTDAYATTHGLATLGDLSKVAATLVIGGAAQFKTDHIGLSSLSTVYGIVPASFDPLAVGEQYSELNAGTVQAAYVNTTDGELATGDYRLLGDPEHIFGFGNVVPVVSATALAQEGPAFSATIERVDRTLTLTTMRELNNAVQIANLSPATVAEQYLQTRGLLSPLKPSDYAG